MRIPVDPAMRSNSAAYARQTPRAFPSRPAMRAASTPRVRLHSMVVGAAINTIWAYHTASCEQPLVSTSCSPNPCPGFESLTNGVNSQSDQKNSSQSQSQEILQKHRPVVSIPRNAEAPPGQARQIPRRVRDQLQAHSLDPAMRSALDAVGPPPPDGRRRRH